MAKAGVKKPRVQGMAKVRRNLKRLDAQMRGQTSLDAAEAMGFTILASAVPEAPAISGTLRRSNAVERKARSVRAGFGVVYARRVHEGFVGQDSLGRTFNQAGNPYLVRGVRAAQREAVKDAGEVVKSAIRKTLP